MKSNLFFVPHEIFGLPLFGWGWALGLLVVFAVLWLFSQVRAGHSISDILAGGWVWLLAIPLVTIVLPAVEVKWPDGTPIGLPVRGYGLMLLVGILSGIGLVSYRASRFGITLDSVISLAIWVMLSGIIGARLFYVVQKWDQFDGQGLERLIEIVKLTEGGLVVYGGMIGGAIGGAVYCARNRMSVLAVADLVVPGFFIGLAFGRIGCLLNGCCYGGVCTSENLPSIQFPRGSPAYLAQVESGRMLGFGGTSTKLPRMIEGIEPDSPAERAGIAAGEQVKSIAIRPTYDPNTHPDPTSPPPFMVEVKLDEHTRRFESASLPDRSLPVHPSQIYSTVDALLLCLLTWLLQPLVHRDGLVFLFGVILYAISRFLVEWIRDDELGQFGTQFTISQWIAMATGSLAALGFFFLVRKPAYRAWAWNRIQS